MIFKKLTVSDERAILHRAKAGPLTLDERADLAVTLAGLLMTEANKGKTRKEKHTQRQLAKMMQDPIGKLFITKISDQSFRTHSNKVSANQIRYLIKQYGIPSFLGGFQKFSFFLFQHFSKLFPKLCMTLFKKMLKHETHNVVIHEDHLATHIKRRISEGVRVNINHLGEAILGEEEAERRLQTYLNDLQKPEIEYISVKISSIFSQINIIAWDNTLERLASKLRRLYQCAEANHYVRQDGSTTAKFVNLDMEEYRDLELTVALFQKVLSEFKGLRAGIVLQAYLPDSFPIQKELTEWAKNRVNQGGAPIKIRLVKGANLAQEIVEAAIQNWEQAPYYTKQETDTSFKQMLEYGLAPENCRAAHIGVGSHNIFDIAYALVLMAENHGEPYVEFEMLEGMADHIRRAVHENSKNMVLYCPVVNDANFVTAIAYLMRRLDENTGPGNFLTTSFDIAVGTDSFKVQEKQFRASLGKTVGHESHRRYKKIPSNSFMNEPNTDWSLAENRNFLASLIEKWSRNYVTINGTMRDGVDPSFNHKVIYRYSVADEKHMQDTVEMACKAKSTSGSLGEAAERFREARGDLIGAMMSDAGKTVSEADAEVSEAIDFIEYYQRSQETIIALEGVCSHPKGVVVVAPPWNFPCAIPVSGIASNLAVGNSVIFKPASETVLVGWILVNLFWDAGFDKERLHFLPLDDEPVGSLLIKHPQVNSVVLTGATETARRFLTMRPGLDLLAETGGKNTIIVTPLADKDLAIKDIIHSSFSHAGQKCSACSLLILEKEVYEDAHFLNQLVDAAASISVGSVWNLENKVGPLIRPPEGDLLRGLTTLEEGELWLLKPEPCPDNPRIWSPGIKCGVSKGSFTHQTELFGPVLGVMKAENLEEAIQLANATPYGLTAGIHSLDTREQTVWKETIQAGNLYINRAITGALVLRQPFGGCKASHFGGFKAGGPNTLFALQRFVDSALPTEWESFPEQLTAFDQSLDKSMLTREERECLDASFKSYSFFERHYFRKSFDPMRITGQNNYLSYALEEGIYIRHTDSNLLALLQTLGALKVLKAPINLSLEEPIKKMFSFEGIDCFVESDRDFCKRIGHGKKIRLFQEPSLDLKEGLSQSFSLFITGLPSSHGRVELIHYLREISLSFDYHRYGNLGEKDAHDRIHERD